MNRHDRWLLFLVSALFVGYGSLRCNVLAINFTQSEPRGLYLVGSATPEVGGMVMLRPLIKHAIAKEGDVVEWTPRGIYVNGGHIKDSEPPKERYGYQLKPFGVYRLAPGQWWLMGTGADSWDSRFCGPIPWDVIAAQIHPLLTWR